MSNIKYKGQETIDVYLAARKLGATNCQAAIEVGVDRHTLANWAKDPNKPEFMEAYKLGETYAQAWDEATLTSLACGHVKGNVVAQIFKMKNLYKDYKDKSEQQITVRNEPADQMDESELDRFLEAYIQRQNAKKGKLLSIVKDSDVIEDAQISEPEKVHRE